MNTHIVGHKTIPTWACSLAFVILLILLLAACSPSIAPQPVEPGSEPASQPPADSHPPVIARAEQRQEVIDGFLWIYQDIYFSDADGDATAMTYELVSSSLTYPLNFTDDPIEASAEEQKTEALFTVTGRCWQKLELVFESRVRDAAGNLSEPVPFQMICTTPPALDIKPVLVSGLLIALPIALLLGLGFWLLFRKQPAERLPALRAMLLLFCLFLLFRLVQLVLHEGGHSLYQVFRGIPFTLYVHPFALSGYSLPSIDNSIWKDILGSLTSIPLSLLISLPFWKRRSTALLPLVMLFPYAAALNDGPNITGIMGGDFRNLVQISGLSPIPFYILGALITLVGLALLFALFPLLGLDPRNKRTLFVLPAALFLQSALSFTVAILFVPGSPIDRQYFLGQEIMAGANSFLLSTVTGVILALLYITLYRKLQTRLPAWLRTEKVEPTWKNLRLPALLATASLVIGLIIII
jgi:hypothetical protein